VLPEFAQVLTSDEQPVPDGRSTKERSET